MDLYDPRRRLRVLNQSSPSIRIATQPVQQPKLSVYTGPMEYPKINVGAPTPQPDLYINAGHGLQKVDYQPPQYQPNQLRA